MPRSKQLMSKFVRNLKQNIRSVAHSVIVVPHGKALLVRTALLFIITLLIAAVADTLISKSRSDVPLVEAITELAVNENNYLPAVNEPKIYENPINGNLMSYTDYQTLLTYHPVAITMNNHSSARHQFGLLSADLVVEVLAEGGITRYVPIYYQNRSVSKIGPVRSLRYYMIEIASGYNDAIILHHGYAGYDGSPGEKYNAKTDARGALAKFDIKNIHTAASTYRDSAKAKKDGYVHSLYTDSTRINSETDRLSKAYGWKLGGDGLQKLAFKNPAGYADRGNFSKVKIEFINLAPKDYTAEFFYVKQDNKYLRSIGGKEDIDLVSNERVNVENVVIEWHNYYPSGDGKARIVIDILGEGDVTILRDGTRIDGKWKKECRTCRTRYFDLNGDEIELNRGRTWISVALKNTKGPVSKVTYE